MALTRVLWSRSDAAPTHSINVYPSGGFIPMLDLPAPLTRRPLQLWPFDTTPCMNLVHQCKSVAFHRNMAVGSWFKISIMTSQVTCQVSSKSSRAKSKGIGTWSLESLFDSQNFIGIATICTEVGEGDPTDWRGSALNICGKND
jgi:hypothetical protein